MATNIQNALNSLSNTGGMGGSVTVTALTGSTFDVAFGGTLANQAEPLIAANFAPQTAVQTVIFASTTTGTSFNLTFNGQTTPEIPFSTTVATLASSIQNALQALPNIGAGGISAVGSGGGGSAMSSPSRSAARWPIHRNRR